jgi:excisionase family DNA binding protein
MMGGDNQFTPDSGRLMTPEEVASHLSVKQGWIYKNWERLDMPFKKVGKLLRISRNSLEAWIENQPPN